MNYISINKEKKEKPRNTCEQLLASPQCSAVSMVSGVYQEIIVRVQWLGGSCNDIAGHTMLYSQLRGWSTLGRQTWGVYVNIILCTLELLFTTKKQISSDVTIFQHPLMYISSFWQLSIPCELLLPFFLLEKHVLFLSNFHSDEVTQLLVKLGCAKRRPATASHPLAFGLLAHAEAVYSVQLYLLKRLQLRYKLS